VSRLDPPSSHDGGFLFLSLPLLYAVMLAAHDASEPAAWLVFNSENHLILLGFSNFRYPAPRP
jgi:hypothetical protein